MKIVFQNRAGETIVREIPVNSKLVGIRIMELHLQSNEELYWLSTEEGQKWLRRNCGVFHHYIPRYNLLPSSNYHIDVDNPEQ